MAYWTEWPRPSVTVNTQISEVERRRVMSSATIESAAVYKNYFKQARLVRQSMRSARGTFIIVEDDERTGFCYIVNGNDKATKVWGAATILVVKE